MAELPFLTAVILKNRAAHSYAEKNGVLLYGVKPDDRIKENGVTYALDLMMNRDNSFYADTRYLRQYLLTHAKDWDVLNTFAYTGSLGVAAAAGGAASVLQTDLSDKFMQTAKRSLSMNKIYFTNKNFLAGNFFPVISRLKRENRSCRKKLHPRRLQRRQENLFRRITQKWVLQNATFLHMTSLHL